MRNNLTKLYSNLLPEERFKAVLSSLYREDTKDAELLAKSCPRKTYTEFDSGYSERMVASRDVAIFFTIEWLMREKELYYAESALKMLSIAMNCVADAYVMCVRDMALYPPFTREKMIEVLNGKVPDSWKQLLNKFRSNLKATVKALESFCNEIEVPLEHLLIWFPLALEWINERNKEFEDVISDENLLKEHLSLYKDYWTKRTGQVFSNV